MKCRVLLPDLSTQASVAVLAPHTVRVLAVLVTLCALVVLPLSTVQATSSTSTVAFRPELVCLRRRPRVRTGKRAWFRGESVCDAFLAFVSM
jgi:hypothetical protein